MTIQLDPDKLANLLTQSARQLNETTLSSLANSRREALNRQSPRSPVCALTTGRWTVTLLPHWTKQWVFIALLAAMFALAANYWHDTQVQHIGELDVAILTDNLPIEVFVD